MSKKEEEEKILQIIPAEGWYAKFKDEPPLYSKLVCFALIERDGGRCVVPMNYSGYIDFCEKTEKFVGLVYSPKENPYYLD